MYLRTVLTELFPAADIVGMNEEELSKTLRLIGEESDQEDPLSVVRGAETLLERFGIQKGLVIHTKDYAMYVGSPLHRDMESGLMFGNMMACAKAVHGSFGTEKEVRRPRLSS